jgi:hypothetical protein
MQHIMQTSEILSAGSVTNLAGLIEKCNFPKDALFLAEQQPSQIVRQEQRQGLLLFTRFGVLANPDAAQDYTSGRIFSDTFELRWEKESDTQYHVVYFGPEREISGLTRLYELHEEKEGNQYYQVIYVGPERKIPSVGWDEQESKNIERYKAHTKQYYLFGEYLQASQLQDMKIRPPDDGHSYYATVRIPRLLLYPRQSGARRLQLYVREYLDEAVGRVRLFRFQKLEDPPKREE